MTGAAFLRVEKLKGGGRIVAAARHNRRAIQAEIGAGGHIDPARICLNETLRGPPTAEDVAQLAKDLMHLAGVARPLRKDAVLAIELVFSLPKEHQIDMRAFFTDCTAWAGDRFGGPQNILSADIHLDESAPHCHVLMVPIIDSAMVGSRLVGNRRTLADTQQSFHALVASRYGLTKAPARLSGAAKATAGTSALRTLQDRNDPALQSAVWPAIRDAIAGDPAPFVAMLGIDLPTQKRRLKSMAAIFTGKGKGPAREAKPIGFASTRKGRNLCSVGFTPDVAPPAPAASTPTAMPSTAAETVRERDRDLDPALYDPETGEFFRAPAGPLRQRKAAAETWVAQALAGRSGSR